jgi:hypothetical protein
MASLQLFLLCRGRSFAGRFRRLRRDRSHRSRAATFFERVPRCWSHIERVPATAHVSNLCRLWLAGRRAGFASRLRSRRLVYWNRCHIHGGPSPFFMTFGLRSHSERMPSRGLFHRTPSKIRSQSSFFGGGGGVLSGITLGVSGVEIGSIGIGFL